MKLLFKQRFFSWFDSYDIYNESGETVYTVKGELSWGHLLKIFNANGDHVATLQQRIFTFLPKFEIYIGGALIGEIKKEFTFFKPSFSLNCNGWRVDGDFFEWCYDITDENGEVIAKIDKQLLNWTDTYTIDVYETKNSLMALLVVLSIDAIKCSQND